MTKIKIVTLLSCLALALLCGPRIFTRDSQVAAEETPLPGASSAALAQLEASRGVEEAFSRALLSGKGQTISVSLEACVLTIEVANHIDCDQAIESGMDWIETERNTVIDLTEMVDGPMSAPRISEISGGLIAGFRVGEKVSSAAIQLSNELSSYGILNSDGGVVIDEQAVSRRTIDLLDQRKIDSRISVRRCDGRLNVLSAGAYEESFIFKKIDENFQNLLNQYKSEFCELGD